MKLVWEFDHITLIVNTPDVRRFIAWIEPADWMSWVRRESSEMIYIECIELFNTGARLSIIKIKICGLA